ncbi:dTDP-4-dehydrorhamnose 3,5-epimerase [Kitasatospora sp. NPDC088264]|uniref:dTDP-4-dehydrorhamnose 3,5-epimerase family protein n=1 Tax=Kitasatospora sp. NPDC088264 TaxID=3155296 RepID=UPI00342B929E
MEPKHSRAVELSIQGAYRVEPIVHEDDRGTFRELHSPRSEPEGCAPLLLAQANCSTSALGALRGISYTDVPPGQTKIVTCVKGAVLDVVVDLRQGSPTFGRWHIEQLDEHNRLALRIGPGLGHGYLSLTDGATVLYLLSTAYDPRHERRVNPLDPGLAIPWPAGITPVLSPKDSAAPGLHEAQSTGLLPVFESHPANH